MEKLTFESAATTVNNMAGELESAWNEVRSAYSQNLGDLTQYWSGKNYNSFATACNNIGDSLYQVVYDAAVNLCTKLHGKIKAIAESEECSVSGFNTPSITKCDDLNTSTDESQLTYDQSTVTGKKDSFINAMNNASSSAQNVQDTARSLKNSWEGENIDSLCTSLAAACTKIGSLISKACTAMANAVEMQDRGEDIRKVMDAIVETATDVSEVVEDTVNKAVDTVKDSIEAAQQAATNTWNGLMDMGQDFLEGLKR